MPDMTNPSNPIEIRPITNREWPVCRMLVPEGFSQPGRPMCFVAAGNDPLRYVGAVAVRCSGAVGYGLRVRVIRTHRRRGLGTSLLRRALTALAELGATQLVCGVDSHAEPDAGPFLLASGFTRQSRLSSLEAELSVMRSKLTSLRERLLARDKIPANAKFVSLPDAPADDIVNLYAEYIRHNPDIPGDSIRSLIQSGRLDNSTVMLMDGHAGGMILWEKKESLITVHARVVTPAYQGGWANAMLMADTIERASNIGCRRVRFESLDDNRDTLKLARRFGAETVMRRDRYFLPLPTELQERQA